MTHQELWPGAPLKSARSFEEESFLPGEDLHFGSVTGTSDDETGPASRHHAAYDPEVIGSVWEYAEAVPGNDPALWRKDEFGDWIHRFDYGRRNAEFGWEIFAPGTGRHNDGVHAMRPMQTVNFLRQFGDAG